MDELEENIRRIKDIIKTYKCSEKDYEIIDYKNILTIRRTEYGSDNCSYYIKYNNNSEARVIFSATGYDNFIKTLKILNYNSKFEYHQGYGFATNYYYYHYNEDGDISNYSDYYYYKNDDDITDEYIKNRNRKEILDGVFEK